MYKMYRDIPKDYKAIPCKYCGSKAVCETTVDEFNDKESNIVCSNEECHQGRSIPIYDWISAVSKWNIYNNPNGFVPTRRPHAVKVCFTCDYARDCIYRAEMTDEMSKSMGCSDHVCINEDLINENLS